eukprot:gene625-775_t
MEPTSSSTSTATQPNKVQIPVKKKPILGKKYLIFYNTCQALGWYYLIISMVFRFLTIGADSLYSTYYSLGSVVCTLQLFAFLEIVHVYLGIVKSGSILPTVAQVLGRNHVLLVALYNVPEVQYHWGVSLLFFVWGVSELIRYPYYLSALMDNNPPEFLTWLRYNAFIVLYPLGFASEKKGSAGISTLNQCSNDTNSVWVVTGASQGLGLALVKKLLSENYKVAGTTRNVESLKKEVGDHPNFLALKTNLSDDQDVKNTVKKVVDHFGRVNVLVNNAGYSVIGSIEEFTDEEARTNFDVNLFGALNFMRNVLPYFRAQKKGLIYNISSIGGFFGEFPSFGIYCSTKFALDGLSESLNTEGSPLGIRVVAVNPGYFRTNFLASTSLVTSKTPISDYSATREMQIKHQLEINGNQPGDPDKAADVLIQVSKSPNPPVHLFLGADAVKYAKMKIDKLSKEIEQWEKISTSTDF